MMLYIKSYNNLIGYVQKNLSDELTPLLYKTVIIHTINGAVKGLLLNLDGRYIMLSGIRNTRIVISKARICAVEYTG